MTATPASSTTSTSLTMASGTGVDIETSNGLKLHFVWVPEVNSTQDGIKQLLRSKSEDKDTAADFDVLALAAGSQTNGRGTSGRAWVGLGGNVFLTLALPTKGQPMTEFVPYPITLLPLRIGTLVAKEIIQALPESKRSAVNVKWPNDVLIGDEKVSGLLIEMESSSHFLVGIGVNVVQVRFC